MFRSRLGLLLSLVPAASLASGCSLALDFDQPIVDGGGVRVDSSPGAIDAGADQFEPNDTTAAASPIDRGRYDLSIAPVGDRDYFSFSLTAASDIEISISSSGGADLDLELYDSPPTAPIEMSRTASSSEEQIRRTTSSGGQLDPGTYVIGVIEFNDQATADYTLTLSIL